MTSSDQFKAWDTMEARLYISLASVVCLGWECLITISHEYTLVWKSRFTITKWLYLLLRYVALICQICNHAITTILFSRAPLSTSTCSSWFAFQSSYLLFVCILFDLILFVRVYALYNKSRKIRLFLSFLLLYELFFFIYMTVLVNRRFIFDDTCLLKESPKEALSVGIAPIITQAIIWGMTWYKQASTRVEATSAPIINIMFRDGLITFLVLSLVFTSLASYTLFVHVLSHSVWSILTSVLAIGGCRIIINMLSLKIPPTVSQVELTTCIVSDTDVDADLDSLSEVTGTVAEFSI